MSEFRVEVVRIGPVEKHPNADRLSITQVLGGYPAIFTSGDFKEGDLATYVPVDALVPVAHPYFSFLAPRTKGGKSHHRVRAMKLRGVFSMGLLVPIPVNNIVNVGDDVAADLGVLKYEPPSEREMSRTTDHAETRKAKRIETAVFERKIYMELAWAAVFDFLGFWMADWQHPVVFFALAVLAVVVATIAISLHRKWSKKPNIPVYDIEGLRRHADAFAEGETVIITEKIHGMNARFVHTGRKFHAASRTMFRGKTATDAWWRVTEKYDLEAKLKTRPNVVLFGEVYGSNVQDLEYGCDPGEIRFAAFDVMNVKTRKYLDVAEFHQFCRELNIPVVPTLYHGPYDRSIVEALAEGNSMIDGAEHMAEGVVIKPLYEQHVHGLGRKFLKLAGQRYLTRKDE